MTAAKATAAFTAIESDLAAQAVARNISLTCAIAIRADDGTLGVIRIRSSSSGATSFVDKDGVTVLTRAEFLSKYVTPFANRLDAIQTAANNAYFASENIANYTAAKGEYY